MTATAAPMITPMTNATIVHRLHDAFASFDGSSAARHRIDLASVWLIGAAPGNPHDKERLARLVEDRLNDTVPPGVDAATEAARLASAILRAEAAHHSSQSTQGGSYIDQIVDQALGLAESPITLARDPLVIEHIGDVAAEVDAAPTPAYIARPIWAEGAHGMLAAVDKAGKTWLAFDLAVAVASGGAWLGAYECERPGAVLLFVGEGSKRKTIRRMRAVCAHYGVALETLPIRVCHRAPHLTSLEHLAMIEEELAATLPVLAIVDPLYLAAAGANSASIFEMAKYLEPIQHETQKVGAALAVIHHWNQTGQGKGRERMSGAGPAEWGRVLVSVSVESRRTHEDHTSDVILGLQFVGDEIPDTELRVRRLVHAETEELSSPMSYDIEVLGDLRASNASQPLPDEKPAVRRVYAALAAQDEPANKHTLGDFLGNDGTTGTGLKERTIQDALARLGTLGLAEVVDQDAYGGNRWALTARESALATPIEPEHEEF